MTPFDPSRPPPQRLARLGVVLDAGHLDECLRMARLCDRAGIDAIWIADRGRLAGIVSLLDQAPAADPWTVARSIAPTLERSRIGVLLDTFVEGFDLAPEATGIEIALPAGLIGRAAAFRSGGSRVGAIVGGFGDLVTVLGGVDDVVLPAWRFPDLENAADEVRAEAVEHGRSAGSLGVAALLPVSIGRTEAEAAARADADPAFEAIGHPARTGIFGTLEDCQDRVIALAHAGITDLRCVLPTSLDVHDVIAQLTGITLGTTDVLVPGALRSPAPPPPDGWGGRPPAPIAPRLSGDSKRR
jgi:alkanesulfonate monooxygenase SsuD/methylene tetrahydromethanopterin reductase-like flavin-dependent oxidoreductase (luciferase family)